MRPEAPTRKPAGHAGVLQAGGCSVIHVHAALAMDYGLQKKTGIGHWPLTLGLKPGLLQLLYAPRRHPKGLD